MPRRSSDVEFTGLDFRRRSLRKTFDITAKRAVSTCLGLGLVCLISVWAFRTAPKKRPGGLLITFAGWSNGASGEIVARFDVANSFARRVQFGVGDVQLRDTDGWPSPSMLGTGTGDWLWIEAGSHLGGLSSRPSAKEATWRLPLIYEEDPTPIVAFLDRIEGVQFGSVHWRLRRRKHRTEFLVGPEMTELSNKHLQPTRQ